MKELNLFGRIVDNDLPLYIDLIRRVTMPYQPIDTRVVLGFPEAQGFITRPISRGGPSVSVTLIIPEDFETQIRKDLEAQGIRFCD